MKHKQCHNNVNSVAGIETQRKLLLVTAQENTTIPTLSATIGKIILSIIGKIHRYTSILREFDYTRVFVT